MKTFITTHKKTIFITLAVLLIFQFFFRFEYQSHGAVRIDHLTGQKEHWCSHYYQKTFGVNIYNPQDPSYRIDCLPPVVVAEATATPEPIVATTPQPSTEPTPQQYVDPTPAPTAAPTHRPCDSYSGPGFRAACERYANPETCEPDSAVDAFIKKQGGRYDCKVVATPVPTAEPTAQTCKPNGYMDALLKKHHLAYTCFGTLGNDRSEWKDAIAEYKREHGQAPSPVPTFTSTHTGDAYYEDLMVYYAKYPSVHRTIVAKHETEMVNGKQHAYTTYWAAPEPGRTDTPPGTPCLIGGSTPGVNECWPIQVR